MEGRLEARAGCIHVNSGDGTISGFMAYALIVQEETLINVLTGTEGRDLLADLSLTGKVLYAGAYITVPDNTNITAIELTSGSVILYKFEQGVTS